MALIKIENVTVQVKDKILLNKVDGSFQNNEIYCLIGTNGSGKTTLLKTILGLIKGKSGEVRVEKDIKIGVALGCEGLFENMSAYENLKHYCILHGYSTTEIMDGLECVGLREVCKKKVKHYSYGMKQKLCLCRALLGNPDILILDEPFNGLDGKSRRNIVKILSDYIKENKMIIMSSHILENYNRDVNYVFFNNGKIITTIKGKNMKKYFLNVKLKFCSLKDSITFMKKYSFINLFFETDKEEEINILIDKEKFRKILQSETDLDYEICGNTLKSLEKMIGGSISIDQGYKG